MMHYGIEQWVDFSRNLVGPETRVEMQAHLATGCEECRKLSGMTERLVSYCGAMALHRAPDAAVRMARAIYPIQGARPRRRAQIPVELVFDSFLAPMPAGLRSTWQVGWQGLYRAGECSLDLRIEPELNSAQATVIGQVTHHVDPRTSMENLKIKLQTGRQVLAEALSNKFGEFQLDYEQKKQVQLVVQLHDARVIHVPLKKLGVDKPAAKSRKSGTK